MKPQSGEFTLAVDVTPEQDNVDTTLGLSESMSDGIDGIAAMVRFNAAGRIDAADGAGFGADKTVAYSAGQTYRVRVVANVAAQTYSVFVTLPDGSSVAVANNHSFRNHHGAGTSLDSWNVNQAAKAGAVGICAVLSP